MATGVESPGSAAAPRISTERGEPRPLEIGLLGPVSVRRDGDPLAMPRSRKCRALLAYLAASGRPQRREHLCELLWELPDDPRGALRGSLSNIRRLLGPALVAEGDTVAIDRAAVVVDDAELKAARPAELSDDELERLAARSESGFGDGIDLPRCPEFEAWLIAAREDARRARRALLAELLRRLSGKPDRALPHARSLAALDPLDGDARAGLVAILAAVGRGEEAERQRMLALDVLRDAGIPPPPALQRPIAPPAATPPRPALVQRIRFATAPDGARIAWSAAGSGPPLVKTANWMSHLEHEWESPLLRHWLHELARERTLIRYDARGNGLSDRRAADLSLDAFISDLVTVAGAADAPAFDLFGLSQGCAVAIAYAAAFPERVRRLVLVGGFATGWRRSGIADVQARWEAMVTLTGSGWGTDNPAFRQLFTSLFLPRATPEQAGWFNELQRVSAAPHEAQRLQRAVGEFDVAHLLGRIRAPTLVFHARGDAMVPFAAGRHLAAHIEGAEFVSLESDNHILLEDEPAWPIFVERLRAFLAN